MFEAGSISRSKALDTPSPIGQHGPTLSRAEVIVEVTQAGLSYRVVINRVKLILASKTDSGRRVDLVMDAVKRECDIESRGNGFKLAEPRRRALRGDEQ